MSAKPGRKEEESDDDIKAALAAVTDAENSPVAPAGEVAERLSIGRDATRKRLNRLADSGEVGSRRIGRARAYWVLPEERQARLDEVEAVDEEDGGADRAGEHVDDDRRDDQEESDGDQEDAAEELLSIVDEIDVPGQMEAKVARRREAVKAVLRYAIEHDHVTRSLAKEEVYPDHTAYYNSGEDPAYSWWKNCIYPALSEVAERSDRLPVAGTDGKWIPEV